MATVDLVRELKSPYEQANTLIVKRRLPSRKARISKKARTRVNRAFVEDTLILGFCIYEMLKNGIEEWSKLIDSGDVEFSWKDSERFSTRFEWWLNNSRMLLGGVERLQERRPEEFGDIARLNEFKQTIQDVSLMCLDSDKTRKSIESLESGQGISFDQAMDELRANLL